MPVIRLDINDDCEFTSCNYCKSSVQRYNNTSLSTAPIHSLYTKTLLSYHHLNCQKCGLYIEMHPKHPTPDEGLIFVCSKAIPCKHCLCYECGLLYNLNPNDKKEDILNQLQYDESAQSTSTQIEPQTQTSDVMNTNNNGITNVGIVSNGTLIAELMNAHSNDVQSDHDSSDGWPLLIGTIMALFVWFGIYWSSPQLFRLTGCGVWLAILYLFTSLFFTENESVQRAVFSLFGFSPIVASIYLLQKSSVDWRHDTAITIQFICVFGCIAYFAMYWSPLEMYLFLVNDFMALTWIEQSVSVFIAVSVGALACILCNNCGFSMDIYVEKEIDTHVSVGLQVTENVEEEVTSKVEEEVTAKVEEVTAKVEMMSSNCVSIKKKRKRRRRKRKKKTVNDV